MSTAHQIVLVTGGTGGLGKAIAKLYIARGAQVVITGRDESKLHHVKSEFGFPDTLHTYQLDVTNNEAVRAFAAWVKIRFERCDILYNNAGTASFKAFSDMTVDEIHEMISVNITGLLYVTRAFLPLMRQTGSGHIVNIASLAGRVATAKASVYAACKAAVIRFSESLSHELREYGLNVTCVLPGPIDTAFLDRADETGNYRQRIRRYLLTPEKAAHIIIRGVEAKKAEIVMPKRLQLMSAVYQILPEFWKKRMAPWINRK